MARPVWSGVVTLGLVTVPVALFTATEDHTVHFHPLQRGTSDRIRNKRVNERTGKEVDTVRGSSWAARAMRMNSSSWNASGPPTSTTPPAGAPTVVRETAAATSSETMGWILASGTRTVSRSIIPSASPLPNSKNWVA
ncbi:hypothetical protein GCM10010276_27470 [Streptomyces longisporus]|uniref:Ku domain-containing protein n=1 Tax=Streptomyces longisporus TaxID=1948 RepID=A0ABP5Z2K3_STRLO